MKIYPMVVCPVSKSVVALNVRAQWSVRSWQIALILSFILSPMRLLYTVKGISGKAHNFAGLGYILKFFGQVQQTDFMGNDFLCTINHEGCLLGFN